MTTGADITTDQINAVKDYEQVLADQENPDNDPEIELSIERATGLVAICVKALAGNPRDRSRIAATYDILVAEGKIQPV